MEYSHIVLQWHKYLSRISAISMVIFRLCSYGYFESNFLLLVLILISREGQLQYINFLGEGA